MRALLMLFALAGAGAAASAADGSPDAAPAAPSVTPAPADASGEPKLPELRLTYGANWNGFGLGEILITLTPDQDPDCYRYESQSDPVGLVRMFYGKPHELSQFCVKNGRVVPRKFAFFHRDSDSFTLDFDMDALKVRDAKGNVRDVPAEAQDRFGIQQAVRLWVIARLKEKDPGAETLKVAQVDDKKVRNYVLAITGRETIEIPAGRFDTIVVQRVDDPNRSTKFWIAPEKDYMPVKVEQLRGGKADLRMVLRQ